MTNREFYERVMAIDGLDKELKDFAQNGIAKLDTRNEKRKSAPSSNTVKNAPYYNRIVEILKDKGVAMNSKEMLVALDEPTFTSQKVQGLMGTLVKTGVLVKVPKAKSKDLQSYALATE